MTNSDNDHKLAGKGGQGTGWQATQNDKIDRELDAALAKYAAVEPRAGIEERILANMRAEQARVPDRAWWRLSVVGVAVALATVVIVSLALVWVSGKPTQVVRQNHPSTSTQGSRPSGTQVAAIGEAAGHPEERGHTGKAAVRDIQLHPQLHSRPRPLPRPNAEAVTAAVPKLDQFPSPRPLSEQERILQAYVAAYPEDSVLLARARSEALQRDRLEETKTLASGDQTTSSDEPSDDSDNYNDPTER